jgi:hypothetical protein
MMMRGPAVSRYPPGWCWVFHTGHYPTCLPLLAGFPTWPLRSRARGLPPLPGLLCPAALRLMAAVRGLLFCPRSCVLLLAPTPGIASAGTSLALISTPTSWWLQVAVCVPRLPALSSAGVPRSRPYLPLGRYQASLGHPRLFPTVSPAHTMVRWGGTQTPSPPECRLDHAPSLADRFIWGGAPICARIRCQALKEVAYCMVP